MSGKYIFIFIVSYVLVTVTTLNFLVLEFMF